MIHELFGYFTTMDIGSNVSLLYMNHALFVFLVHDQNKIKFYILAAFYWILTLLDYT